MFREIKLMPLNEPIEPYLDWNEADDPGDDPLPTCSCDDHFGDDADCEVHGTSTVVKH